MNETTEKTEKAAIVATSYVVLRQFTGGWEQLTTVECRSASEARGKAFAGLATEEQEEGQILVAVPARSWQPKRRELVTQPRSVER